MLSDHGLVEIKPNLNGIQRIYRFGDYGLSLINASIAHAYPFAWEAAVIKFNKENAHEVVYDTGLTQDVEVFDNDDDVNTFIEHAATVLTQLAEKGE